MKILKGSANKNINNCIKKLTPMQKLNIAIGYPFEAKDIKTAIKQGVFNDLDDVDFYCLCREYQLGDEYLQIAIDKGLFINKNLFTRLEYAAETNSLNYVKKELLQCIDDSRFLKILNHLLMSACKFGALDVIKYLHIELGADINYINERDETPLMNAAFDGKLDVIKYLVEHGSDIFFKNQNGATVLNYAFQNYEILKYFLDLRVHPDYGYPLLQAAMYSNQKEIDLLLKHGASINLQDEDLDSALLNAFIVNNVTLFKYLINRGADLNLLYHNNNTLLMYAAKYGNLEIIKILFEHGVDASLVNNKRLNAADIAFEHVHMNAVSLILSLMENSYEELPLLSPIEEMECFNETAERILGCYRSKKSNYNYRDTFKSK